MESSTLIWEHLVRRGRETVSTAEFAVLARRLRRNPKRASDHLRRAGYLVPLFRGYYYVRTPTERALRNDRYNPLELFDLAAKAKGIGPYYVGLHSALRENGLSHEHRRDEAIISATLYRPLGVRIGARRFVILKWKPALLAFGIRRDRPYPVSDPEKTVLDLAYLDLWRVRRGGPPSGEWKDYADRVEPRRLLRYARFYPRPVRHALEAER